MRAIYNSQTDWSAQIVEKATLDNLDQKAIKLAREKYKEKNTNATFYDEIDNKTRSIATDGVECYVELMELFKKYCAAAIREDRDQKRVLYVDPADYNTLHIFFDAK